MATQTQTPGEDAGIMDAQKPVTPKIPRLPFWATAVDTYLQGRASPWSKLTPNNIPSGHALPNPTVGNGASRFPSWVSGVSPTQTDPTTRWNPPRSDAKPQPLPPGVGPNNPPPTDPDSKPQPGPNPNPQPNPEAKPSPTAPEPAQGPTPKPYPDARPMGTPKWAMTAPGNPNPKPEPDKPLPTYQQPAEPMTDAYGFNPYGRAPRQIGAFTGLADGAFGGSNKGAMGGQGATDSGRGLIWAPTGGAGRQAWGWVDPRYTGFAAPAMNPIGGPPPAPTPAEPKPQPQKPEPKPKPVDPPPGPSPEPKPQPKPDVPKFPTPRNPFPDIPLQPRNPNQPGLTPVRPGPPKGPLPPPDPKPKPIDSRPNPNPPKDPFGNPKPKNPNDFGVPRNPGATPLKPVRPLDPEPKPQPVPTRAPWTIKKPVIQPLPKGGVPRQTKGPTLQPFKPKGK